MMLQEGEGAGLVVTGPRLETDACQRLQLHYQSLEEPAADPASPPVRVNEQVHPVLAWSQGVPDAAVADDFLGCGIDCQPATTRMTTLVELAIVEPPFVNAQRAIGVDGVVEGDDGIRIRISE